MRVNNIIFRIIMIILILTISSLLLIACSDGSEFITNDTLYTELFWDANTEDDLAGYKIYYGTESGNYVNVIDVGYVTTYLIKDMGINENNVYYVAITAYDISNNESDFSEEIRFGYKVTYP